MAIYIMELGSIFLKRLSHASTGEMAGVKERFFIGGGHIALFRANRAFTDRSNT